MDKPSCQYLIGKICLMGGVHKAGCKCKYYRKGGKEMARKLTIKKFDGDDQYSYAVFYADEVKGRGSVIFYGQARPIVSGLSRREASHHKNQLEGKLK